MLDSVRRFVKFALLGVFTVAMSGCSVVTDIFSRPAETYEISAPTEFEGLQGGTLSHLLIVEPTALKSLNSQSVVLKPSPIIIEYLAGARWADRLPKMVQSKLVEAFENTKKVKAVGKPGDSLLIDHRIVTDIRAFQFELRENLAVVEFSVKILDDESGKVIATKIFSKKAASNDATNLGIITALDFAFDEIVKDLAKWVFLKI